MANVSASQQLPSSAEYRFNHDFSELLPVDPSLGLPTLTKVPGSKPACYMAANCLSISNVEFFSVGSVNSIYESAHPRDNSALEKWTNDVGGPLAAKRLTNEAIGAGKLIEEFLQSHDRDQPKPPISSRYSDYCQGLRQLLPKFKKPVWRNQVLIVNFQLGVFGIVDRIGAYDEWDSALLDIKTALSPKGNLKWIEDKVLQIAAYELINDSLFPIETVGLVFFIRDGSFDEYFFDEEQIRPYQEEWLRRLSEVRRIRALNSAA